MNNPKVNSISLTILSLILILILPTLVSTLKLHKQQTLQDQKLLYYQSLYTKQTQLKLTLQNINNEINYLHTIIQQVQGLSSIKIVVLEETLANQRDQLYTLQQNYSLPLKLKVAHCKNLTQQEFYSIDLATQKIQTELTAIQANIKILKAKSPDCAICNELQADFKWSKGYLNKIREIQSTACPPLKPLSIQNGTTPQPIQIANTTGYFNISNLKADNWILGNTTLDDYYLKQLQLITSKNVSRCPINTPYIEAGSTYCTNCTKLYPYYSLEKLKCIACPSSQSFNKDSHSCRNSTTSVINGSNPVYIDGGSLGQTSCSHGLYYNSTLKVCVCPSNVPFLNVNKECVPCILPRHFNEKTRQCEECFPGTGFNTQNRVCEKCSGKTPLLSNGICTKCQDGSYYNQKSNSCLTCKGNQQFNSSTQKCQCPNYAPYWNGDKCFNCEAPEYYDKDKKSCRQCEKNLFFNKQTNTCQKCPESTPVANGLICTTCPGFKFWDPKDQLCKQCPISSYYNSKSGLCNQCPSGSSYNSTTNKCIITIYSCPSNQVYNYTIKKCQCPKDQPNFNGINCVKCQSFEIWNGKSRTCQQCKDNTYYFDGKCMECKKGEYFNEKSKKCEYNGCFSNQILNSDTKVCQCPKHIPYFTGDKCVSCTAPHFWDKNNAACKACPLNQYLEKDGNKCLGCPSEFPYFNNKSCIACPIGNKFDSKTGMCNGLQTSCPSNYQFQQESGKCFCPKDAPYDDGTGCVACESPNFWNQRDSKCKVCDIYHYFDPDTKTCIKCPQTHPVFNPQNKKCQDAIFACPSTYIFNSVTNSCICPSTAPFDNNQSCQKCYLPNFWNLDQLKCQSCPAGQHYDINQLKCVYCPEDTPLFNGKQCIKCPQGQVYLSSKRICVKQQINCKQSYVYNPITQTCICPSIQPFDNGNNCISCSLPLYWSQLQRQCLQCPQGTIYNYHINQCLGKQQTNNINKNNITIINGTTSVSQQQEDTYFQHKQIMKCICPPQTPKNREPMCQSCPKHTESNNEICQCQGINGTNIEQKCKQPYEWNQEEGNCICPEEKPFDTGSDCVTCSLPKFWSQDNKECMYCCQSKYYDTNKEMCLYCPSETPLLQNFICVKCPHGTLFIQQSRKCLPYSEYCPETFVYDEFQEQCVCPETAPFLDNQRCVSCYLPKYWNHNTDTCDSCPQFQVYNTEFKRCEYCPSQRPFFDRFRCVDCPAETLFNQQTRSCISYDSLCPETFKYDPADKKCFCPKYAPFNNGQRCQTCYLPKYWNHTSLACESCQQFKLYDTKLKDCTYCPQETPFLSGDSLCIECPSRTLFVKQSRRCMSYEQYCPQTFVYDQILGRCVCPKYSPFYNGERCVTCYLPDYWNHDTNKCQECPQFQIYNIQLKKCSYCPQQKPFLDIYKCVACPSGTLFINESRTCINYQEYCPQTFTYDEQDKKCICPKSAPFYNGDKCLSCYLPNYWNHETLACESCSQQKYYNTQLKRCEYCPRETPLLQNYKCVVCPKGTIFLNQSKKCIDYSEYCPQTYIYNETFQQCVCPKNAPFKDGNRCISCYLPQYWNHDTAKCESCPQFQLYNIALKACVFCPPETPYLDSTKCVRCPENTAFVNKTHSCIRYQDMCPTNFQYNPITRDCTCPQQTPFTNGQQCISCYLPKYWNHKTLQCESCPQFQYYNGLRKSCLYCPSNTPVLADNGTCIKCPIRTLYVNDKKKCVSYSQYCPETSVYNETIQKCVCPESTPFDNGKQCISCYLPNFWNRDTLKCQQCPDFQYYNPDNNVCEFCPTETPLLNGYKCKACPRETLFDIQSRICISYEEYCGATFTYNLKTKECVCPQQTPFNNGQICISCYLPEYWNPGSKKCQSCPEYQIYDIKKKGCSKCPQQTPLVQNYKCVRCPVNTLFQNKTQSCISLSQYCPLTFQYNSTTKNCTCPSQTPFNDGQKCVSCYLPQYWNHNTNSCQYCPESKYYNINSKECEHCPINKPNLVDHVCQICPQKTFFIQSKHRCLTNSQLCPETYQYNPNNKKCECPNDTPFDDGKKCNSCYLPKYWNHDTNQCENCQDGKKYDTNLKMCVLRQ